MHPLDHTDPLAPLRVHFQLPEGVIYLDGNSLGPLPKAAIVRMREVVEQQWGVGLIRSWNAAGWVELPRSVGVKIAPLIGAEADSVRVCDSTSVNLYKLLSAALALNPTRRGIVSEADTFPTDLYMAQGLLAQLGRAPSDLTLASASAPLETCINADTAVVLLSHVNYRTGECLDMAALTALAHRYGALVIWDLAHSAGALPVALAECQADFAVGCGYKYLNGGPGAPSFIYAAPRHQAQLANPLSGWFGHANPFAFSAQYSPAAGANRLLTGTPPVLSMAALDAALEVFSHTSLAALRQKSLALTALCAELMQPLCERYGFANITPMPQRGSQLCYRHPQAYAICQALIARGVIGDFRAPDILRLGFAPLYLRYADVSTAVAELAALMQAEAWRAPQFNLRAAVT